MTDNRSSKFGRKLDVLARQLAADSGADPDARVDGPNGKPWPLWCGFRDAARAQLSTERQAALADEKAAMLASLPPRSPEADNAPLTIFGDHDDNTIKQMRECMQVGNVVAGVVCADGHKGYAQPVGGVVALKGQVSVSGVGFDIACGNYCVRTDTRIDDIRDRIGTIIRDVQSIISFGVGRKNAERVEHELFDRADSWREAGTEDMRMMAQAQLGTVGGGNHYVDIFYDDEGFVWIGAHFGSRGLGHGSATRYLKMAGGRDGMDVPPAVVDLQTEIGQRYLSAMKLAGDYAYAGREWVVDRVRKIIGGRVTDSVHNHHNYAFDEVHNGELLWVVRKGATPAFPGQRGFVGGSMGDDAVIIEGVDSPQSRASLYSTIHGAGRTMSRTKAKATFKRAEMDAWLREKGVILMGGDLDESPMAYRRLPEVLAHHTGTIKVLHTLHPVAVAMAGPGEFDPYRD